MPCRLVSCLLTPGCSSLHAPRVLDASSSAALDSVERGGANNRLKRLVHLTAHLMLTTCRDNLIHTTRFPGGRRRRC